MIEKIYEIESGTMLGKAGNAQQLRRIRFHQKKKIRKQHNNPKRKNKEATQHCSLTSQMYNIIPSISNT